jgi:hypothetical protein
MVAALRVAPGRSGEAIIARNADDFVMGGPSREARAVPTATETAPPPRRSRLARGIACYAGAIG